MRQKPNAKPPLPDRFAAAPDPVLRGGSLAVEFSDPDLAGQRILIDVRDSNGDLLGPIAMDVDPDGNGSVVWAVPEDWFGATLLLQYPTSADHTVAVNG